MATIIFKPTERCDANCIYCGVITKPNRARDMSFDLLGLVFQRINEYLEAADPVERVTLTWHGGEPLLLGADYFYKAIELQDQYCPNTKHRINHIMQSNLTLMNPKLLAAVKALGIRSMGTSFEPEPFIRGIGYNKDGTVNSELYNKRFMRGTNVLAENGMKWGYIYVVTKKSLEDPLRLFYYLTNMRLTGGVMLNPVLCYDDMDADVAITPEEYAHFLGAIFPTWVRHKERWEEVEPFRSIYKIFTEYKPVTGCMESGDCAYHYLYIGPDGKTSHCGRAGDWDVETYGNIQDRSMVEIFNDPLRQYLQERVPHVYENECKGCRFWDICHGGCPLDARMTNNGDWYHKTYWCQTKLIFFEQYVEPTLGIRFNPELYRQANQRKGNRNIGKSMVDPNRLQNV